VATSDRRISRHHIKITAEKDGLFLTDLGSDNGTFTNDKRLRPQTPMRLDRTTLVRLGPETTLELRPES
jgi:pSer/pThr/pTyr-binding forkhead associated (FHA) protein